MSDEYTRPAAPRTQVAYSRAAAQLAFDYCPPMYTCQKCGWPVVDGYCCSTCGDTNPREAELEKRDAE
jgi:hypothetical protein